MIKLMIGLLIIACIAPLFIRGPDGEPIMTLSDWSVPIPAFVSSLLDESPAVAPSDPAAPIEVYKWQDEEGVWHFSDSPVDLESAEQVHIGEVNVMDPWTPPAVTPEAKGASVNQTLPTGTSISTNQMQEMMDTVNNLQETIDERKADMDAIALPAK